MFMHVLVHVLILATPTAVADWLQSLSTVEENGGDQIIDRRLAIGAAIVEELRAAVFRDTGFRCSAGVAHNKVIQYSAFIHTACCT